ncbi:MAG: (2Fe-2S)-binding protein [Candidatus Tenebribacter davisii]|jgi:carbon-monoxide dehydrogenase small subunit|nr:(2Fe-2S)-binding protein [Candidatus Tenebribacter davisii]
MVKLKINVNGKDHNLEVEDTMRLLDILRDVLGLTGTKEGCGVGECGACTVIMNGDAVNSCMVLATQANNAIIETVENLERDNVLSKLQNAFVEEGAIQCGFCTPGMLMSAKALLDKNPHPNEEQIKEALEGNLCRCTGYIPILNAVKKAAE